MSIEHPTPTTRSERQASTLRAVAAWLDSHPDIDTFLSIDVGDDAMNVVAVAHSAEDMAAIARKAGGRFDKHGDDVWFDLIQPIGPTATLKITAFRETICERVVTGNETVEVEEPDQGAIDALPKIKRTKIVEKVEWRCEPLLAGEAGTS